MCLLKQSIRATYLNNEFNQDIRKNNTIPQLGFMYSEFAFACRCRNIATLDKIVDYIENFVYKYSLIRKLETEM